MRYFKCNDPKAIAAEIQYVADCEALQHAGHVFAARYPGATPVFKTDALGRDFHGLVFHPVMISPLWTRPMRSAGDVQRPRTTLERGVKGEERLRQIEVLAELNTVWHEHMPKVKADRQPLWDALGTDWGSVMMGGFQSFLQDEHLYMRTAAQQADSWVEILGSEYDRAKADHLASKRSDQQARQAA